MKYNGAETSSNMCVSSLLGSTPHPHFALNNACATDKSISKSEKIQVHGLHNSNNDEYAATLVVPYSPWNAVWTECRLEANGCIPTV